MEKRELERYENLVKRLKAVEITVYKHGPMWVVKRGKRLRLVEGIPSEAIAEDIARSIGAALAAVAEKIIQYTELVHANTRQTELKLFGDSGVQGDTDQH